MNFRFGSVRMWVNYKANYMWVNYKGKLRKCYFCGTIHGDCPQKEIVRAMEAERDPKACVQESTRL